MDLPENLISLRLYGELDIRLKNNYRKLKFSILLQTVLVTALTVLVSEPTARSLYWKLIGDNKTFFMVVGFLLLFALFFYVALSKMTKYLDQVGEGIENILSESTEPIHLITELKPIEIRLNEIKAETAGAGVSGRRETKK